MRSIETLMHEHRVIEHGLATLTALAGRWKDTGTLDRDKALALLDFFRVFADACHHAKEEGTLFPELERRGIPREGGPIGVMLYDHEQGRLLLGQMRQALEEPCNREMFIQAAQQYVQHLRQHIWKEDNVLFQLAQRLLTQEEDAEIQRRFDQHEREQLGEGVHERYHQLIHDLERELGVTPAAVASQAPIPPASHCGCSHAEHYHEQAGIPRDEPLC